MKALDIKIGDKLIAMNDHHYIGDDTRFCTQDKIYTITGTRYDIYYYYFKDDQGIDHPCSQNWIRLFFVIL